MCSMSCNGDACIFGYRPAAFCIVWYNGWGLSSEASRMATLWQQDLMSEFIGTISACAKSRSEGVVRSAPVACIAAFLWILSSFFTTPLPVLLLPNFLNDGAHHTSTAYSILATATP